MSTPRTISLKGSRGQVFMEMIVGTMLLLAIVLMLIGSIAFESKMTVRLARETRARLLLEGEMERMRGVSALALPVCEKEEFAPFLGVPKGLQYSTFRRTVSRDETAGMAHVTLEAEVPGGDRKPTLVTVEGLLRLRGEGEP